MPARTNAFQRLVTLINGSLAGTARVVESAMVPDKLTGELREIDILITTESATYPISIAIEVVGRGRRADSPWVEAMQAKHAALPTNKLVLVAEKGFSKPALAKAKHYNIEALTIERACAADWDLLANLAATGVFEITTLNYSCSFICTFEGGRRELVKVPLQMMIDSSAGAFTLDAFVRRLLNSPAFREALYDHIKGAGEHDFWLSYTEPMGLGSLEHDGEEGQAIELRIGLHVLRSETTVAYAAGKYREIPFVTGTSTAIGAPLQFVLVRSPNGRCHGVLADASGIRSIINSTQVQVSKREC